MVVGRVDVELDLGTRVGVAKTKLSLLLITLLETLEELVGVKTDTAQEVGGNIASVASLAFDAGEDSLDATGQVLVGKADGGLGLLGGREVHLEGGLEVVGHDTLGDAVDVLEGVGGVPPGGESLDLDHLAEEGEVCLGSLDILKVQTNSVLLVDDLEEGIAQSTLVQEVIDLGHLERVPCRVVGQLGAWELYNWVLSLLETGRQARLQEAAALDFFPALLQKFF